MTILSTMPTGAGGEWQLVQYEQDFFAYGYDTEIKSCWDVSVNQCGTLTEVLKHCLSIADLCKKNIEKFEKEKLTSKNPQGWDLLIYHEHKELGMLEKFASVLKNLLNSQKILTEMGINV